ncbi:MAG: hypothetical protein EZS28_003006 [Streblomastix strix]|uniref:Uncharacterized protein n=1 Tax=Streblomastix strix TaxID=222440 RepID=A0A5J4X3X3_9EUKA|nr:MAG: hypothetical protein EZS28_003006 [Streblomastix strix]
MDIFPGLQREGFYKTKNHYGTIQNSQVADQNLSNAGGEQHRGFVEGILNVCVLFEKHTRHEYLTISEWKAFWREVDTDPYLDTVRMEMDEDDNHHNRLDHDHDHDHNHRYYKE